MGFFDRFKKTAEKGDNAAEQEVKKTFVFEAVPANLEELQKLPESDLDSPFKAAALTILALCNYEKDEAATIEMLEFLNGPDNVSTSQQQFLRDRLSGKYYKTFSFFEGAARDNTYTPTMPLTITVMEGPDSYVKENRATLFIKSAGADAPRPIMLRQKPSSGQWFVSEIPCLADIRVPKRQDSWS